METALSDRLPWIPAWMELPITHCFSWIPAKAGIHSLSSFRDSAGRSPGHGRLIKGMTGIGVGIDLRHSPGEPAMAADRPAVHARNIEVIRAFERRRSTSCYVKYENQKSMICGLFHESGNPLPKFLARPRGGPPSRLLPHTWSCRPYEARAAREARSAQAPTWRLSSDRSQLRQPLRRPPRNTS